MCRQGYEDSYRYLSSRGIIQCADCRTAKLAAGLTATSDWRRPGTCESCEQLLRDEDHRRLPEELCRVFDEAAEEIRLRRLGVMARLSSLSLSPYRLSARLMGRTAWMVMSGLLPSEKTVKALMSYSPALVTCPFDSL